MLMKDSENIENERNPLRLIISVQPLLIFGVCVSHAFFLLVQDYFLKPYVVLHLAIFT